MSRMQLRPTTHQAIDELNLAALNLISIQSRLSKTKAAISWADTFEVNGHPVRVEARGDFEYGVPHGIDVDTSAVINNMFQEQGCPADNTVTCSAYALIMALQLKDGGGTYQVLRESLVRLASTTFLIEGWVSLDGTPARQQTPHGKRIQTTFRLVERITHEQAGMREEIGRPFGSGATIRIELPREVAANIRARHVKPLDLNFMLSLEGVASRLLFRMLDAMLHDGQMEFEVGLLEWGQRCRILDLRPDKIRRVFQPAHDELIARAYLQSAEFVGRGKDQRIRYVFQAQRPDHPLDAEQLALKGRVKALHVTDGQAERFVRHYRDARQRVVLAEALVNGRKNLRNPGGFAWDVLTDTEHRYALPHSVNAVTAVPRSSVSTVDMPPLAAYAPARPTEVVEVDEDGNGAARGVLKALVAQEKLTAGEMQACLGLLEQRRVSAAEITMLSVPKKKVIPSEQVARWMLRPTPLL